jgi:hypothetical protein
MLVSFVGRTAPHADIVSEAVVYEPVQGSVTHIDGLQAAIVNLLPSAHAPARRRKHLVLDQHAAGVRAQRCYVR